MQTGLKLFPAACFLSYQAKPWDEDEVHPPQEGPPNLRGLRGYVMHAAGGSGLGIGRDLSRIKEQVVIVDSALTMRELGLMPSLEDKKEKKGSGASHIGIYHDVPTGHRLVFLPWCDVDKRRKRSETWRRYFVRQVDVARATARGEVQAYQWGRLVIGDGSEAVQALQDMLATPQAISVDVETVGDMPDMAITAIGLASDDVSVSVPWAGYTSKVFGHQSGLKNQQIRDLIATILASPAHPKVFHNGGFDRAVFASLGMPCNGEYEDTILMMKIVFPELYRNLQFSAGLAAQFEPWKDAFKDQRKALLAAHKARIKELGIKKAADDWHEIPLVPLLTYNCKDTAATQVLYRWLKPRLEGTYRGQEKYDMLRGLAEMAAEQWLHGQAVDRAERDAMVKRGQADLAALVEKWHSIVGPDVKPFGEKSKKPLFDYFFKTLRAPVIARSDATGEPSMNTFTLTTWDTSGKQPLSDAAFTLFRIRKLQKNLQAFLDPLAGKDRVYAKPNVTGTVGTRFSYSEPNLQQYAKDQKAQRFTTGEKFKLAPNVRKLLVAEPGCLIAELDYKALELMAVAYRTNNAMWFDWMAKGLDMHVMHVGLMYGKWLHRKGCAAHGCDGGEHYCTSPDAEADWVDPNGLRQITKVTTYARFYNRKGNPDPVVRLLKAKMPTLEREVVEEVFERFDEAIPHIVQWHEAAAESDRRNGYVETGIGGWRLPTTNPPDENRYRSFEIQSTVGHVVSQAMLKLRPRLETRLQQRMLVQVHDAFIVQGREKDILSVVRAAKECMEWEIPELWGFKGVRFPVEAKVGPNWSDMSTVHV